MFLVRDGTITAFDKLKKSKDQKKDMSFIKRHIKIIVALGVIAAGAFVYFNFFHQSLPKNYEIVLPVRTITLEKSDFNTTVTVDGHVESQDVSTVSSTVTGAKVVSVNVAVGDTVQKGDVIAVLDSEMIDDQIEKEKENIGNQIETAQEAYDNAVLVKDRNWGTFDQARQAMETACDESTINAIESAQAAKMAELIPYQTDVEMKKNAMDAAYNELQQCILNSPTPTEDSITSPDDTTETENDDLTLSQNTMPPENTCIEENKAYETAAKKYSDALALLTQMNESGLYSPSNSAQAACDSATASFNQIDYQQQTLEANVTATRDRLEELQSGTSDTLESLYEQKNDYTIKANASGKITALNATVGSIASGTIATIQNLDALQINCNIQEYDIQKIQIGMEAIVTSDANDQQYHGMVTAISATSSESAQQATSSLGSTMAASGSVTFPVTITLDPDSDLLIGMNAKVEIILDSIHDVYTVPIDATTTDENGSTIIYVQNESGEFEPLVVQTGKANDYSIVIESNQLDEGMIIKAFAIDPLDPNTATYQLVDLNDDPESTGTDHE